MFTAGFRSSDHITLDRGGGGHGIISHHKTDHTGIPACFAYYKMASEE